MKREVAAEIVDSLKEAGVDFVASLTEANLHDLVRALGEDTAIHHVPVTREEEGIGICAGRLPGREKAGDGDDERRLSIVGERLGDGLYSSGHTGLDVDRSQRRRRRGKRRACHRRRADRAGVASHAHCVRESRPL